jgi:hypothetical protein
MRIPHEIARFEVDMDRLVPLALELNDNPPGGLQRNRTPWLFRFDPEAKKFGELVAQHPRYDMGERAGARRPGVVIEPETDRLRPRRASRETRDRLADPKYVAPGGLDKHMPNDRPLPARS